MAAPNILIVVVDGLRASALGAYGNTTTQTPALDQFAAESHLFDWCFAPAVDLAAIYQSLWHSSHPARLSSTLAQSLPDMLAAAGYSTTLITDEPQLTSVPTAGDFDQCIQLHGPLPQDAPSARATDSSHTALSRLFGSVGELLALDASAANQKNPRLIWAHSRGMYGPWDAPLKLQQSLLDEGDPPPVESTVPPDFTISTSDDPDAAFRFGCAYAAQVMVLDECWDGVLQAIDSTGGANQWIVMLIGARGFPLGEHRRVGGFDPRLYAEQLHVPWLIQLPEGLNRLARSGRLTSHIDLLPTLVAAVNHPEKLTPIVDGINAIPVETTIWRASSESLIASDTLGARAIRTADWCLRLAATSSSDAELYVRPDDRWEANDVAKLCPDVVESLSLRLESTLKPPSGSMPDAQE